MERTQKEDKEKLQEGGEVTRHRRTIEKQKMKMRDKGRLSQKGTSMKGLPKATVTHLSVLAAEPLSVQALEGLESPYTGQVGVREWIIHGVHLSLLTG